MRSDFATRRHDYEPTAGNNRNGACLRFVSHRIVNVWNDLPAKEECFRCQNSFESF
jgi:hypothetical protein